MSKFVHLHTHSHYSLLQALPKIPELVAAAKKDGMTALALTDNGNLYGAIEFYKTCKKEGLKPIIGVDAYVALRTRHNKDAGVDNRRTRLVLLAKNETGYKNLIKLVTASYLEGFYYRPRIDRELIEKYAEGLIAIIPSINSELGTAIQHNDLPQAEKIADFYKDTFGKENFYLEITHHPEMEGHEKLMAELISFAEKSNIPLVAANEVYYIEPSEHKIRETLISIQSGVGPREKGAFDEAKNFSFIATKAMEKIFKDRPDALANSAKIAEMCELELTLGHWVFPDYKTENNVSHDAELRNIVYEGIKKRSLSETPELKTRIEHELKVIKDKGYSPYFLVVADLLRFARENNIYTTTRGSVAGSIVSYLTYITTVNPIEYKLPFERFLNPERPSAPDIDMDIADNRRDEMIEYARKKYGATHVAQIGTFGTMMARGSTRDVARALGYPYSTGDQIAKLIPFGSQGFPMTIDTALETVPELAALYKSDTDAKIIIDTAKRIEGNARHISVHAAGVVISPQPLTEYVPLQYDPKGEGKVITQFDMHAVEDAGLLKFDFLGIRNLAILADSVKIAEKYRGVKVDIDNIPLNDRRTFEMLANGETVGLFQLNGAGMTRFLKELKPTTIHDINAMVALYRPGPMEVIPEYIKRKHNPALVTYPDPRMKKYLEDSYGLIVYQDDLLFSAIELAGYSWLEADKFRKAVGKKIPAEMAAQKEKLITGIVKNGQTQKFAEKLWKLFEPFQSYGFNKAHAASYGKVAYQTAYMKANFPVVYMTAVLTAESGDVEKISEIVTECKRMGIPVLPPSINDSFGGFTVVKEEAGGEKIRFGLYTIKNFGEGIADVVIQERKNSGKFKSLADFLDRIKDKNLNKKSLEALIKSGALDFLGERGEMLGNLEAILSYNKEVNGLSPNQDSLFGLMTNTATIPQLRLEKTPPATQAEKLGWEKELLGLYISGHPLDKYKEKFTSRSRDINALKAQSKEGMTVVAGGIIEEMKCILTKSGEQMFFGRLADYGGNIEMVIFPRIAAQFKDLLRPEQCVAIKGRYSLRNGNPSIVADKVKTL